MGVLNNESKSVPRWLEETVVREGNLDVGIFSDVLDAVFEQPEHVAGNCEHNLYPLNFFAQHTHLLAIVFEDYPNHLADCDDQSAESDWGPVIDYNPFETSPDRTFSLGVTASLKVPNAGRGANNKLTAANYKWVDPQETKDVVEENPTGFLAPFYLCDKGVANSGLWGSYRENKNCSKEPKYKPATSL